MEKIYTKSDLPTLSLYNNLTGYIPERLLTHSALPLTKNRANHVGYRGRKLPYWYGELGYEKCNIVEKWKENVFHKDLRVNLSCNERDRIYGDKWIKFLESNKATLGVESGASVMDFTGELEKTIELHQITHPKDDFYKVQDLYLQGLEGQYKLNQISPRCFEAIALKTILVLYEGEYSGILTPGRHYIPLKKDFSNINEVVEKLLDDRYLQEMADKAYNEIALNPEYSYQNFINKVDGIINEEFIHRNKIKAIPYKPEEFEKVLRQVSLKKKVYTLGLSFYSKLPLPARLLIKALVRPKSACRFVSVRLKLLFTKKIGLSS